MIYLGSITIEGFGSIIEPIKYKLKRLGLNKIEGENGAGKTTITNALAWVLYKQTVKKKSSIIPWPHVIDNNYKGTMVRLSFHDTVNKYEIIRCSEYKGKILGKQGGNRLIILKDGVELMGKDLRSKDDYQKWIVKTIGYTFELFKSTILFAQELERLMKEDGPSKKKIFDEAFETTFIGKAKEEVEKRLCDNNKHLADSEHKLDVLQEKIKGIHDQLKQQKDMVANFANEKREKFKANAIKRKQQRMLLDDKREELAMAKPMAALVKEKDDLEKAEFKLSMAVQGAQSKVQELELQEKGLKDEFRYFKGVCNKCKQPLPAKEIVSYKTGIKKQLTELRIKKNPLMANAEAKMSEHLQVMGQLKKVAKKIRPCPSVEAIRSQITTCKERIKELDEELIEIQNTKCKHDISGLNLKLTESANKETELKNEIKAIQKKLNVDQWLIKDPLSNSGLKAFIFDSMLGRTNNFLKQYTNIIGFEVKVYIDMDSANKDIKISVIRGGDEVPYEDISKGQKQLVDVAVAFALNDTVTSIKPINILIMDEIFENLSTENIEKVANIVIKKSNNRAVHIITHQSTFNPPNCHTTYFRLNDKHQTIMDSSTASA